MSGTGMGTGAAGHVEKRQKKSFEAMTEEFEIISKLALQLSIQSTGILQRFSGSTPEPAGEEEKEPIQSPIFIVRLQQIEKDLKKSLLKISNNLIQLEELW